MTADFSNEGTDFSGLYKDASAPKDPDPADELFRQLSTANAPQAPAVVNDAGLAPRTATPAATTPAVAPTATQAPVNPTSVQNPAADQAALLARLAPMGVKSIADLKNKSDVELRKISMDAVGYEQRQRDLAKHFFRNPDGSWDFSKGPDGRETGLGPDGKVLPPAGATPETPATPATPASPAPKPATAKTTPAKKPVVKAKKPAAKAKKAVSKPKAPVVKRKPVSTARKPAAKTVSKPKAPVVKAKTASTTVRRAS